MLTNYVWRGRVPHTQSRAPSRPSPSPVPSRSGEVKSKQAGARPFSPPQQPYRSLLPESSRSSTPGRDNDDDGDVDDIAYDEDEDEFGLPSVTSMRKTRPKVKYNPPQPPEHRPNESPNNGLPTPSTYLSNTRLRANSSDIAEERGNLGYPTNKADGKILRPQYKEILNGMLKKMLIIYALL